MPFGLAGAGLARAGVRRNPFAWPAPFAGAGGRFGYRRHQAEVTFAQQFVDPSTHLGIGGHTQGIGLAGQLRTICQQEHQLQIAMARVAAENFVKLLDMPRFVQSFLQRMTTPRVGCRSSSSMGIKSLTMKFASSLPCALVDDAADH